MLVTLPFIEPENQMLWYFQNANVCFVMVFRKEGFISPKIFIYFFINSDSNLIQTQMLTLKLSQIEP